FGRDLAYHYPTCDLLITAASYEVYRLNLNQGRFLNPISTDATSGVNVCAINPAHQLFGFGTQDGVVEFWDPRSRSRVGLLAPSFPVEESNEQGFQVTAMSYRNDGLSLAVGTSSGHILLYDLRSSSPWLVKDHQYGDGGRGKVISADCKIMKIWDRENAKLISNPFAYTEYREKVIKEKLEAKRESRIRATKQLPKVNKDLANRLLRSSEKKKKGAQEATTLLQDKRFIELFTNPEYEVDKNTTEYQLSHPTE
ncbi:5067_t:CDS:2, partial [Racocetra fulgida]